MKRLQSPFRRLINSTLFPVSFHARPSYIPGHLSIIRSLVSASANIPSLDQKFHSNGSVSGSSSDGGSSSSSDSDSDGEFDDIEDHENEGGPNATKYREVAIDKLGRSYGTGRRKTAVARVWIKQGVGECIVNKMPIADYFPSGPRSHALEPFIVTETAGMFDVLSTVKGGGQMGQF
jgi:hypothetical protein